MNAFREVATAYRIAWGYLAPFTAIHLALRLLAAAVIVPLLGLVLAGVLATSGEAVLTDQDIAGFLLTPGGFAGALVVVSLLLIASVLEVAVMTNTLRLHQHNAMRALIEGLSLILARFTSLFRFALLLVLRLLLIAVPLLLLSGLVAWAALGEYDINYYLSTQPPAFLAAAASIGALLLLLSIVLVWQLSSWAVALHFLLFRQVAPRRCFALSAAELQDDQLEVIRRLLAWLLVRILLAALVAAIAGFLIGQLQALVGLDLRLIVLYTLALILVWMFADAVLAALANGALAALLDRLYRDATGRQPLAVQQLAAETGSRRLAWGAILLPAALLVVGAIYAGGELLEGVSGERRVEIIAHRGAASARPENTLSAVVKALEDRADWVEIDVQETADGEVVVAHDSDFMKLAGVDLKVWNATMADLAEIDIGSWFDPAYSAERTPTLREVLLTAKGRGKVLIELKYYGHDIALEKRVAQIVDETGMTDAVAAMSLKRPGVEKMQQLRPDWPQGVLAATAIGDLSALEVDFFALNTGQISLRLIRRAHAQGKKVYAWTVDDPVTMTRLISIGVDGLITNKPALARTVMETRNQLSAPERLLLWLSDQFRLDRFQLSADLSDA
ncbi:MAG: hypothetical protein K9L82_11855 [Chromatiaceae bacterium]|nr:hypothetical protein [Chromatiaceae bacterium]MCF7993991.1 hypothetical protein [Chromatiaceae bacterium]